MRTIFAFLALSLLVAGRAAAEAPAAPDFQWKSWQALPVQDNGRQKPLDTLAWETLRMVANKTSLTDPDSGARLDATAAYLTMLFDWRSGNAASPAPAGMEGDPRTTYYLAHQPDKWDRMPLLFIDSPELRTVLGMDAATRTISPLDLSRAAVKLPDGKTQPDFPTWADSLSSGDQENLTQLEKEALQVADRLWTYQEHRMGRRLALVPIKRSANGEWASVADLLSVQLDEQRDPGGALRRTADQLHKLVDAYHAKDAGTFNAVSADLVADLRAAGPTLGEYPAPRRMALEVAYNHWAPFRFAWILALIACGCAMLSMGSGVRAFYYAAWTSQALGLLAMVVGFAMRITISGRAPVTNMYESVIYVGLGVAVFGMLLELIYRQKFVLAAAGAVSCVALLLADTCPAILDPSLQPLQPVLRNNFWLVTHVMTITLSYAVLALGLGISDITLGYYLAGSGESPDVPALSKFTYRCLQTGVVLLAMGIFLGGVWAHYSWGRFWGWDPKEVWALIALLGYIALLHARYVGWLDNLGFAAATAFCFTLVMVAWYGVNFVLGAGLHSYGFGTRGAHNYVYAAIGLQLLYLAAALVRINGTRSMSQPTA